MNPSRFLHCLTPRARLAATKIAIPVAVAAVTMALGARAQTAVPANPFAGLVAQGSGALQGARTSNSPYPGTLKIEVDLTDLDQKIMRVRETLPVKPGAVTLLYPQWLPGNHSPRGAVNKIAGLQITANGKPVEWRRDTLDVFAFHLTVPDGASTLSITFDHLSPLTEATGRVVMTPEIIGLQWNTVVLYPAGYAASAITTQASARLPSAWQSATALDVDKLSPLADGQWVEFKPASLEKLVDSPLWAGKYTRRIELDPVGKAPVFLNLFADSAASLEATAEQVAAHKAMVTQADAVFGSRHFSRYEFLLALTDNFGGIGLEHSESSENALPPGYFTEWKKSSTRSTLLPHEYTHSWNGKFRRPADLNTPHFNTPMQDSLLWIYEGQTQYWGYVIATRAGLVPLGDALDNLAETAAGLSARAGRAWRNLQDTTNEPVISLRGALDWPDWQRREEYYNEGELIWLDADTKIREMAKGAKSLNDVARTFFGVEDGRINVMPYQFDDYVKALNSVAPLDWAAFLRERLDTHTNTHVLDGITRSGWKLVFSDKQSEHAKAVETQRKRNDFYYSLGFDVDKDGKLGAMAWGGPAFKAGMTPRSQLVAVGSIAYKPENLREAITQAKDGRGIELLIKTGNVYKAVKIDYRDGLRYPKLERIAAQPDLLTPLLTAVK